jgi:uncharacterized protein
MTAARAALGLAVAVAAGWAISRSAGDCLLRPRPEDTPDQPRHGSRAQALAEHVAGDFLFMARFLVLGAAIAAALQTALP